MWRVIEFGTKLLLQVVVVFSFVTLTVHNLIVPLGFDADQLLLVERCINVSILLVMAMEMPSSIKLMLHGWSLLRFRQRCQGSPTRQVADNNSLEFASVSCRWVQTNGKRYADFGKLSPRMRSPASMLILGILRTISFIAQTPITVLSILLNFSVSRADAFIPLVCLSLPTGLGSALAIAGLNMYSDAIEKRRFLSEASYSIGDEPRTPATLNNRPVKKTTRSPTIDSGDTLNSELPFTVKTS
ncbi:hypothetical protein DSO57_1025151 [Entomophthora muscae]|uniref:Uncharacterized protein n=1 Tax=Entomophthora muscae TaxID=34485 RepID=A0ACC2TPX0_9FUNG|nr:hypothetical protein DSO57_1025151 [Entomophthora muscae]